MPYKRTQMLIFSAIAVLIVAACDGEAAGPRGAVDDADVTGEVVVFAAASLTDAFEEIEQGFVQQHPDAEIVFNVAASSALARQVNQGAPADVFASANDAQMTEVTDAGNVAGEPTMFTTNSLQIAVTPGNPAGVTELADFEDDEVTTAVCAQQVPCGAAAVEAFDVGGVDAAPSSLEETVRAVLTKVELDEVDAGLVYRTDVLSAQGDVEGIDFPEAGQAETGYPIAALEAARNEEGAQAFVDYVLSDAGQEVLADHGFGGS